MINRTPDFSMTRDFETWQINLGVNTYSDGRPNVYFICQTFQGNTYHRNIDRARIVSFDSIEFKGDYDWGQRIDYLAVVTLTKQEIDWVRNLTDEVA